MTNFGLFVGFGAPVAGRETQAARVFGEAMEYYARLQGQGDIESFEGALLEAHGGDLNGFILLRGDPVKLGMLRASEEWARLVARANFVVRDVGIVSAILDEEAQRFISANEAMTADLR
jgi:hypothetical protein